MINGLEIIQQDQTIATTHSHKEEANWIIEEIKLFKAHSQHAIDFVVEDDGLAPFYEIGDLVAGFKRYKEHICESKVETLLK